MTNVEDIDRLMEPRGRPESDRKTLTGAVMAEAKTAAPAEAAKPATEQKVAGPIREHAAKALAELVGLKAIRDEYKVSLRTARKMMAEAEKQKPNLYAAAAVKAGIDVSKIGDGGWIDWILDPANSARVKEFIKNLMEIIALIAPLFI